MNDKEEFIRHFREIQPKFSRLYVDILTKAKLTLPQYVLLSQISSSGTISMTDASEKLHITKPAITNLVDRLEKNRFLKRIPHPQDRRISLLQIQTKGEKAVHEAQMRVLSFLLKTLDEFNTTEKKIIARFYSLLSETLDQVLARSKINRK